MLRDARTQTWSNAGAELAQSSRKADAKLGSSSCPVHRLQATLQAELLQHRTRAPIAKDAEQRAEETEQALVKVCVVCMRV